MGARRNGARYTLWNFKNGAEVLGVSKVVSEDSVHRALKRGTLEEWDAWITIQERAGIGKGDFGRPAVCLRGSGG